MLRLSFNKIAEGSEESKQYRREDEEIVFMSLMDCS